MSPLGLLLIVVAFAFIWFAILRPQKRRQLEQAQMWESLAEGTEIVTAGGLYGTVTGFQDDDLLVEIAPDLEVRVARRAIAGVISREPEAEGEELEEVPEPEEPLAEARRYPEDAS
jgi:preprotein translocase subunit YajC